MFDIGWTEILVIACIAIIVVGPKDLPRMLRTLGQTMGKVRRLSREFQSTFNDAIREAEKQADIADMKKQVEEVGNINPLADLKKSIEEDKGVKTGDSPRATGQPPAAGSDIKQESGAHQESTAAAPSTSTEAQRPLPEDSKA